MEDLKRIKNRIDWFCENKVNAFSPTISPAPKHMDKKEIESIEQAIKFFHKNGVQEIVVQKKYMGSYCDIYLHKNMEDTYFVSRNGYKINHIDLKQAIDACKELHARIDWTNLSIVIIQSEMMPWAVLGKGLIENEFRGYLNVHQNHCEHLLNSNIYEKIEQVKQSETYQTFVEDKANLTGKQMREKYPVHILRQYNSLGEFKVLDLDIYQKSIAIYEKQINHFGIQGDIHFKPFNILKKIFEDGTEQIVNDNLSYKEVNDDEFLHFFISTDEELQVAIDEVYKWFASLEQEMEEGIVIKPCEAFVANMPPAFKVRNNNYLTMIYGVDFQEDYDYYVQRRSIRHKLECSINDWALNYELLKVNYKDIDKENYFLKNLVLDRIIGEKVESTLDSRL